MDHAPYRERKAGRQGFQPMGGDKEVFFIGWSTGIPSGGK
jgi:hypothetical protein